MFSPLGASPTTKSFEVCRRNTSRAVAQVAPWARSRAILRLVCSIKKRRKGHGRKKARKWKIVLFRLHLESRVRVCRQGSFRWWLLLRELTSFRKKNLEAIILIWIMARSDHHTNRVLNFAEVTQDRCRLNLKINHIDTGGLLAVWSLFLSAGPDSRVSVAIIKRLFQEATNFCRPRIQGRQKDTHMLYRESHLFQSTFPYNYPYSTITDLAKLCGLSMPWPRLWNEQTAVGWINNRQHPTW